MILNFYKVQTIEHQDNQVNAQIFINKNHAIFKGHFPNNPIVPGVVILQIIKEIIEPLIGSKLMLKAARNIKFKAIINPEIHPELNLQIILKIDGDTVKVKNVTRFKTVLDSFDEQGNPMIQTTDALQLSATYLTQVL